jgi:large subunit ribosomal protein L18
MAKITNKDARIRRHRRLRKKVSGTAEIPRMSVCCTQRHIHIQFIDDVAGRTLAAASTLEAEFRQQKGVKADMDGAVALARIAAKRAQDVKIGAVVFDRGGFNYHGRVKAIADTAREAGLKF